MTIRIGNYEFVIFKVTRKEVMQLVIDTTASKQEAEAIKNTDSFKALQEQARIIRKARG